MNPRRRPGDMHSHTRFEPGRHRRNRLHGVTGRTAAVARLALLVVGLFGAGCTHFRYAASMDVQTVRLNKGATHFSSEGLAHEFELSDPSGVACAFWTAIAKTTANRLSAEHRARSRADAAFVWFTYKVEQILPISGLNCGIVLKQLGSTVDLRRHGGLWQLEDATARSPFRSTEFTLLLRGEYFSDLGLGVGLDVSPSYGGVVVDEDRGSAASYARWPLQLRLHFIPPFLFGLGFMAHGAWELFSGSPEYGASVAFRRWLADTVFLDLGAGWRLEQAYAWNGELKGTLERRGFQASAGLTFLW